MKNRELRGYFEKTFDMGTVKKLNHTITLLEEFTGWEFSIRKCTCDGVPIYILGIESCSVSESAYVLLKTSTYPVKAMVYFKETFGPSETILNMLHGWFDASLLTLNETETSIKMKLRLRGVEQQKEIT